VTLGQMLAWHRSLCGQCSPDRACGEYLDIVDEFTVPRQLYAGPVAPSTILSVREGAAT
jgi:hypothetical protein